MSERNVAVQWLRGLAAVEVMIWHSDLASKGISDWSIQTSAYKPLGGIGVEVFFVVSGYLMSLITSKSVTTRSFIKGRILRLVPLYWLFTTLVVVAFLVNADWRLGQFDASAVSVVSSYLFLPQAGFPILMVGWTLQYEVVFYAAVAPFLWWSTSSDRPGIAWRRSAFSLGVAALALAGVVFSVSRHSNPWVSHLVTPYFFAFGYGWLVQILFSRDGLPERWHGVGFALLFVAAFAFAECSDAAMLKRMALAAGLVTLLLWAPVMRSPRLAAGGLAALVGEASYSLYLSHWFVLSVFGKLVAMTSLPASADLPVRIVGLALAVVVGCLLYRLIERPLDHRIRRGGSATRGPDGGGHADAGVSRAIPRETGLAALAAGSPLPAAIAERHEDRQVSAKENEGAAKDRFL